MNELDIFVEALRRNLRMLTIPGFEYIEQAVYDAYMVVISERNKRAVNEHGVRQRERT